MIEKCCKCGQILFETKLVDEKGNTGIFGNIPKIEQEGDDRVIVCVTCSAKNVLIDVEDINGSKKQKISHAKED
jgi:hypothetical protein